MHTKPHVTLFVPAHFRLHFGRSFGATFAPVGSFWGHFGYIFCMKKRTEAPKVLQERPKALTPEIKSRFGSHSEGIFLTFAGKMCVFVVLFAVLFFLRFLSRPERSMGWAHMQSVHAGAVQTHFSVFAFLLKNRFQQTSF